MPNISKTKITKRKHAWRKCPLGYHWRSPSHVDAHTRRKFNVKEHYRKGSCVKNKSGKDILYDDELYLIANSYFSNLGKSVSKNILNNPNANKFDHLIEGWTQYWNDIFKPKVPLDPDFVKVLILTESSFRPKIKEFASRGAGYAFGIMQVTEETVKFLAGHKNEIRNHFIHIDQKDLFDPSVNIAAGIRWLFRKKEIADAKLGEASWIETIMFYKGYRTMNGNGVRNFIREYEKLKN